MAAKPKTIDDYLATVPSEQRAALEKVRKAVQVAAPDAEECINYGVPAFRLGGKCIAGFGASYALFLLPHERRCRGRAPERVSEV